MSRQERKRQQVLARLMEDSAGQAFTTLLSDRAFRSASQRRTASMVSFLVEKLGVPTYLGPDERLALQASHLMYPAAAGWVAQGVKRRVRIESQQVLVPSDEAAFGSFLAERRAEGVRVNINYLGEQVLGQEQAERRVERYAELLSRPDVEAISVKVSSIESQVNLLAFGATLSRLCETLRPLYELALVHPYTRADGTTVPKLINLDMESYDDLQITLSLFRELLSEPRFRSLTAGIVLQAYLPESFALQRELTRWAQARVQQGGAPVRLRIVKGANLAMERARAASQGWQLPVYPQKALVDANYKRMIEYGCRPENACAVQLGVASHNVFDLALALTLRAHYGVEADVGLELLWGMAEPLRNAVKELCNDVLVYAPLVDTDKFATAMAYLVRRLDENTSKENFLRQSFGMEVNGEAFAEQQRRFRESYAARLSLPNEPPRQTRRPIRITGDRFANEPDTNFEDASKRKQLLDALSQHLLAKMPELPILVAGRRTGGGNWADGFDPSRPGVVPYRYELAHRSQLIAQMDAAQRAQGRFRRRSLSERSQLLMAVAQQLRRSRYDLCARMAIDGGKNLAEADREVSEAIDFAEYYRISFMQLSADETLAFAARGVTLVTPPWNFPLAIAAGGVFAALMAGNCVLLKPPLETLWVGRRLAEICWSAGVPEDVLQVCQCTDELASTLVVDPRIAQVVLTGSVQTARHFLSLRPALRLFAETGGKNAIIATAQCDRDQLIADVIDSAFGHSGQKCSAASLLICEAELYDDDSFLSNLADAASSLSVGSALQPQHRITPLILPPSGVLAQGLRELSEGSEWLLQPEQDRGNPRLVTPGIKIGVAPGSFDHQTEFFGPLLGVMRSEDLHEAIEFANGTPYGLTSGLHSLDEREHARWLRRIRAGNLYINRSITGAIVRRQPFGGVKASSVGPGAKAGGPNYVAQLAEARVGVSRVAPHPPNPGVARLLVQAKAYLDAEALKRLSQAACDYGQAYSKVFGQSVDPSEVEGERNLFYYEPVPHMVVRAEQQAQLPDILMACAAAMTVGANFLLSINSEQQRRHPCLRRLPALPVIVEESDHLRARLDELFRVRVVGLIDAELRVSAQQRGLHLEDSPVVPLGRIELLRYLWERSLSDRYHRYGNLAASMLRDGAQSGAPGP